MKPEIKLSTIPYIEDFLSRQEADDLFAFVKTLPPVRPVNPRNPRSNIRKVSYGCYSVLPESRTGMTVHGGGASWLATAPGEIQMLAARTTVYAGAAINYLSLLGYENQFDHIGFHHHAEDFTLLSQAVYVLSLGQDRELLTRPNGSRDRSQYERLTPAHGSLYVLPHGYNTTHEHAILDSKTPCGLRISINMKHIDDAYLLAHSTTHAASSTRPPGQPFERAPGPPRIYCCRKDCEYPADAVLVDKRTPYGNHKKLQGTAWFAEVIRQMRDPEFAAKVETELRGKDLLCWCKQVNPNCHAYAWLTLANPEITANLAPSSKCSEPGCKKKVFGGHRPEYGITTNGRCVIHGGSEIRIQETL